MSQYDSIGTQYDAIKRTPFNKLERFNFQKNVQPFLETSGISVIHLACGTGFYSEPLLDWGADSVTGGDLSPVMVAAAVSRLSQTMYAKRSRFVQGDGCEPRPYNSDGFDVATGVWLLNYAKNPDQLTSMFRTVSTNLKPNGVFVGVCLEPTDDVASVAAALSDAVFAKTGLKYEYQHELPDGVGYQLQVTGIPPPGSSPTVHQV